jgi:hypothetical protein
MCCAQYCRRGGRGAAVRAGAEAVPALSGIMLKRRIILANLSSPIRHPARRDCNSTQIRASVERKTVR